jgi:hypothetical protein
MARTASCASMTTCCGEWALSEGCREIAIISREVRRERPTQRRQQKAEHHDDDEGDDERDLQPVTAPLRQHDLASIAANLRDGAMDAGEAAWLSDALSKIADGEPADIALGLRRQRAEMLAAKKTRDCILRDAAKTMPGLPLTEAAKRIHRAMLRYRESAWQRERLLDQCPARHRWEWQALRLRDHVPKPRSIRRVLASARL